MLMGFIDCCLGVGPTCNPQLSVDPNWTGGEPTLLVVRLGIPVLASKYEWSYGLAPGLHVDRSDLFTINVVGWNHVLISASSFLDLSFVICYHDSLWSI